MTTETKRKLIIRHNMARLLHNDGGLGAGITEERLQAIHAGLSRGLGNNITEDSGQFRPGSLGLKGVIGAVSEAMRFVQFDDNLPDGQIPLGSAQAGAHIIRSITELAPFRSLNTEVGAVVACKVLETLGVKVGLHKVLAEDLADTAKMAVHGHGDRLTKVIENHSTPLVATESAPISFEKLGDKLAKLNVDEKNDLDNSVTGPSM